MRKNKISIKGNYFPDYGGVSVHISRLAEKLSADGQLNCVYITSNPKGYKETRFKVRNAYYPGLRYGIFQSLLWLIKYGLWDRSKLLHFHGHPVWESLTLLLLLFIRKRIVFTIHDQLMLYNLNNYPKIVLQVFKIVLRSNKIEWIVVNENIESQIHRICPKTELITIIPAYLPVESSDIALNKEIEVFIQSKSKILSVYAHKVRKLDNKDLYGIDLALEAIAKVKSQISNVGLIICVPNQDGDEHFENYLWIIQELNIHDDVLLFSKPINNPIELWRTSHIVIRPSLTDGDSLVVREAISQGTYVIASDCVTRPKEVITFKSGCIEDLVHKIVTVLKWEKNKAPINITSNYAFVKSVYANCSLK